MSREIVPVLVPVVLPTIEPIKSTDYKVNPITGCWIWLKHSDPEGYALDDFGRFIERQVYREHKGEIPDGYEIDHLCWHPRCINPEHLQAITGVENNRAKPTNVLTMEKAKQIREKAAAGVPTVALVQEFGAAPSTIRSVLHNVSWTDPDYKPVLNYHSKREANPRTVRRVRALRAGGMSYGEIVDQTHIRRSKVIAYCSGRYLGEEFNTVFTDASPSQKID
jgi:hypothetical protein